MTNGSALYLKLVTGNTEGIDLKDPKIANSIFEELSRAIEDESRASEAALAWKNWEDCTGGGEPKRIGENGEPDKPISYDIHKGTLTPSKGFSEKYRLAHEGMDVPGSPDGAPSSELPRALDQWDAYLASGCQTGTTPAPEILEELEAQGPELTPKVNEDISPYGPVRLWEGLLSKDMDKFMQGCYETVTSVGATGLAITMSGDNPLTKQARRMLEEGIKTLPNSETKTLLEGSIKNADALTNFFAKKVEEDVKTIMSLFTGAPQKKKLEELKETYKDLQEILGYNHESKKKKPHQNQTLDSLEADNTKTTKTQLEEQDIAAIMTYYRVRSLGANSKKALEIGKAAGEVHMAIMTENKRRNSLSQKEKDEFIKELIEKNTNKESRTEDLASKLARGTWNKSLDATNVVKSYLLKGLAKAAMGIPVVGPAIAGAILVCDAATTYAKNTLKFKNDRQSPTTAKDILNNIKGSEGISKKLEEGITDQISGSINKIAKSENDLDNRLKKQEELANTAGLGSLGTISK